MLNQILRLLFSTNDRPTTANKQPHGPVISTKKAVKCEKFFKSLSKDVLNHEQGGKIVSSVDIYDLPVQVTVVWGSRLADLGGNDDDN